MPTEKTCFIWSCGRMKKTCCLADSLDSLKMKGCKNLGIWPEKMNMERIQIVLEKCGTEIDEDDVFQALTDSTSFILLAEEQLGFPRPPVENIFADLIEKSRVSVAGSAETKYIGPTEDPFDYHGKQLIREVFTESLYMRVMQMTLLTMQREDLEAIVQVKPSEIVGFPCSVVEELQVAASSVLVRYDKTLKKIDLLYLRASQLKAAKALKNPTSFV